MCVIWNIKYYFGTLLSITLNQHKIIDPSVMFQKDAMYILAVDSYQISYSIQTLSEGILVYIGCRKIEIEAA